MEGGDASPSFAVPEAPSTRISGVAPTDQFGPFIVKEEEEEPEVPLRRCRSVGATLFGSSSSSDGGVAPVQVNFSLPLLSSQATREALRQGTAPALRAELSALGPHFEFGSLSSTPVAPTLPSFNEDSTSAARDEPSLPPLAERATVVNRVGEMSPSVLGCSLPTRSDPPATALTCDHSPANTLAGPSAVPLSAPLEAEDFEGATSSIWGDFQSFLTRSGKIFPVSDLKIAYEKF